LTRVYRIARAVFAANPFDGEGSYLFGGRWSSSGSRVVYTAEHLSLAMLEYLVHLDPNRLPADLVLAQAEIPDRVRRIRVRKKNLPAGWDRYPAPAELVHVGDRFVRDAKAAVLIVPSVLAPTECNWILNPSHPDFKSIRILPTEPFQFDRRLIANRQRPEGRARGKRARRR
jgi:RES domain-containing protein